MPYSEYVLTDVGYRAPVAGIDPLPEIWGLSNTDEEAFEHSGTTGYPTTHSWIFERDGKALAMFDGSPDEGGVEIADADVLVKLIADYGFPPETVVGDDGLPVVPEAAGVFI